MQPEGFTGFYFTYECFDESQLWILSLLAILIFAITFSPMVVRVDYLSGTIRYGF